jgi:hypothetical protein
MSKTIEEILSDVELGPLVKAFVDKRVGQGIQTALSKRLDTSNLTQRLYRLENAAKLEAVKNDLRFHVFQKATESGLDYDLVKDVPFSTPEEADKKIAAILSFSKNKAAQDLNQTFSNAFKPGTGLGSSTGNNPRTFNDFVKEFSTEKG